MMKNILIKTILFSSLALSLNADFIRDNIKLVVTDSKTGLMWQDDVIGSTMDWNTAITTCENLTLGGYSDWRLPNIRELKSIVDKSRINPTLYHNFTSFISNDYWSSTTVYSIPSVAWDVGFDNGNIGNDTKNVREYVRCVRAGQ